jgi:threonine synthase
MAVTAFSAAKRMRGVEVTTWAAIPNGNTGQPQNATMYNDKCIQVTGTFGAAGTIGIEGSNDGINFFPLHDPSSAALTFTAAGLKEILENPVFVRPGLAAGDGTTALTVILCQRSGYV